MQDTAPETHDVTQGQSPTNEYHLYKVETGYSSNGKNPQYMWCVARSVREATDIFPDATGVELNKGVLALHPLLEARMLSGEIVKGKATHAQEATA